MGDTDRTECLQKQVLDALSRNAPLEIRGGGSKTFYGRTTADLSLLETSAHRGIVNYEPTELVITARAGTRICDINSALSERGQQLAFEPPELDGKATLGGTLATAFSGPGRPWCGGARDHILGTRILNGRGKILRFGGEVMKNVAGYDISRLMVGSMGTLGVILEASVKALPRPNAEATLVLSMDRDSSLHLFSKLGAAPYPLSGAVYLENRAYIRLNGSEAGVNEARREIGGDEFPGGTQFWQDLREFNLPFFQSSLPVWRISLPTRMTPALSGDALIDWGGGQWWLCSDAPAEVIRESVTSAGGHATLFFGGDRMSNVFQPLTPDMASLQKRIKDAFDPAGIFNPGRMTSDT